MEERIYFALWSYELKDRELKRTAIDFIWIQEFKQFKDVTKKQLSEIREKEHKENEHLSDPQENTNIRLVIKTT